MSNFRSHQFKQANPLLPLPQNKNKMLLPLPQNKNKMLLPLSQNKNKMRFDCLGGQNLQLICDFNRGMLHTQPVQLVVWKRLYSWLRSLGTCQSYLSIKSHINSDWLNSNQDQHPSMLLLMMWWKNKVYIKWKVCFLSYHFQSLIFFKSFHTNQKWGKWVNTNQHI